MTVTIPVAVSEDDGLHVSVRVRWGQGSALQFGEGGRNRVVNPRHPVPEPLKHPLIGTTQHDLGEPNGARLRVIAGPMRVFDRTIEVPVAQPEGGVDITLSSPS